MKIISVFLFAIICYNGLHSQNYTIKDGIVRSGSGFFYDSGGIDGKYQGGEDYICTVSNKENSRLVMSFNKFNLAEGDWLAIYDGASTDAALIEVFTSKNPLSGEVNASGTSLTFVFHSEVNNNGDGWAATIKHEKQDKDEHTGNHFHADEGLVFIYSLKGLKSDADGDMIEEALTSLDYVLDSEVHLEQQNIYVNSTNEDNIYKIKDFIISLQDKLGYAFSIDFIRLVETSGHSIKH